MDWTWCTIGIHINDKSTIEGQSPLSFVKMNSLISDYFRLNKTDLFCLTSAFIIGLLESIISRLTTSKISIFLASL